jgi:hypothetical protein
MCQGSFGSTTRAVVMTWLVITTYRRRDSPDSDEARTRGLEMSALMSLSAFCVSSI